MTSSEARRIQKGPDSQAEKIRARTLLRVHSHSPGSPDRFV